MATAKKVKPTSKPLTLDDLTPDPKNARAHSEDNLEAIAVSIDTVGPARPILINEHGVIIAGNGTQLAALKRGVKKLKIIDADGETLVAVKVRGLTPAQKTYLAVADNRTADMATWKPEVVKQLVAEGYGDVVNSVWYPVELNQLLGIQEGTDADVLPKRFARNQQAKVTTPMFRFGAYELEMGNEEGELLRKRLELYTAAGGTLQGLFSQVMAKVNDKIDGVPDVQGND